MRDDGLAASKEARMGHAGRVLWLGPLVMLLAVVTLVEAAQASLDGGGVPVAVSDIAAAATPVPA